LRSLQEIQLDFGEEAKA